MIASSSPPRRHGPLVVSKHMLSRNRSSMPYCFALRMIPGTMSLPFSVGQLCHTRTQKLTSSRLLTQQRRSRWAQHSRFPRNCRASMSEPRTSEPQCATPYRHEPVPTKGSYMILPGAGWCQPCPSNK